MSRTILAEESNFSKLAPNVEQILSKLKDDSSHHDHLVALLIILMAESGFSLSPTTENPDETKVWWPHQEIDIPDNWKSRNNGIYEIIFHLRALPNATCKLVAIALGDTLILNLLPEVSCIRSRSLAVQSLKYVNCYSEELTGRFINIKDLSIRFKNALSTPIRCEYMMRADMVNPSLQGLPLDLKLHLLDMLQVQDVVRLSGCSKEFNKLSKEPSLWRKLLKRDFNFYPEDGDYKLHYMRLLLFNNAGNARSLKYKTRFLSYLRYRELI